MKRFFILTALFLAWAVPNAPAQAMDYVLAMSWEPAFCAQMAQQGRGDKPECKQLAGTYGATNLILHGLWPQPESNSYCGVPASVKQYDKPGQWDRLPAVQYSTSETVKQEGTYMPGAVSYLDRHEWTKHGTCSGQIPDAYFTQAMGLVSSMQGTRTAKLLADNVGGTITSDALCSTLAADFGSKIMKSAQINVSQVKVNGRKQSVLGEVWIYLSDATAPLALSPQNLVQGYGSLKCDKRPLGVLAAK